MEVKDKLLLNGARYSGNIEKGIPHGYGKYETANISYEGYFYNGLFSLFGVLTDKVIKYKYIGGFDRGMKNGYGKLIFDDGKYFEGVFNDNICNSYGYMEYSDGEVYVGEFKSNLANGSGTVYYANGNVFTGLFKNDKECGLGVIVEKDNNSFGIKVEYKEDGYTLIHGQVKLTTELNTHMVYRIVENNEFKFYGMIDKFSNLIKGIYHYNSDSSFDTFVGDITNEFKNGILYLKNGDIYKGFYENDSLTGKGEYTVLGKGTYIGEFINGKKCGDFIFVDYNQNRYHHRYDNDRLISAREEVQ